MNRENSTVDYDTCVAHRFDFLVACSQHIHMSYTRTRTHARTHARIYIIIIIIKLIPINKVVFNPQNCFYFFTASLITLFGLCARYFTKPQHFTRKKLIVHIERFTDQLA